MSDKSKTVEGLPCLAIGELRWLGLLGPQGPQRVRIRRRGAGFNVGWSRDRSQLIIRFNGEKGERCRQSVALTSRRLSFGERVYFICPISGAPALTLYLVDGRLGSQRALGLGSRRRTQVRARRANGATPIRSGEQRAPQSQGRGCATALAVHVERGTIFRLPLGIIEAETAGARR